MTLQARGLAVARGQRTLLAELDFEVRPGEALRVLGRNGSGKTSLLRVLCGLAAPLRGEVRWHGQAMAARREAFNLGLVYIGHGQGLKDDLTATENLQASAWLAGRACSREQALWALQQLGLAERAHLPARVLSQGQRRRVLLARLALPAAVQLLILDEPFNALDQDSVAVLTRLLERHLDAGAALVYTTHQGQAVRAAHHHEIELGQPQLLGAA